MTKEELKKQLKKYRPIRAEYEQVEKERDWLVKNMDSLRASNLDGMPRGSGVSDPTSLAYEKVQALLDDYDRQLAELAAEQKKIEDMLTVLDSEERTLMRHKYFEGMTWEEVCVAMYRSWGTVHNMHSAILNKLREE